MTPRPSRALRVGLLASHPIQYLSPLLRALAVECDLRVFYAHRQSRDDQAAAGYGVAFDWDTDLLTGYDYEFLMNVAAVPDVGRFEGCDCPGLFELISRDRFDAFIVSGWYLLAYLQAAVACRQQGVPVVVRGDSQLQTPRTRLKRLAKELSTRIILAQFDGFLSVGKRNRAYLERYGAHPQRIFSVPHFVDNAYFRDRAAMASRDRAAIRASLRARPDDFVVLFVGRFVAFKRPLDLVHAAALLREQMPGLRLLFVGAGVLDAEIQSSAAELGVSVNVVGFRNQSELPPIYRAADLLVLPSDGYETWGLVVNEAFSCGLPAVLSDAVGSAPDLVIDGETGATFPCGDVAALAGAIQRMAHTLRCRDLQPQLSAVCERYSCHAALSGTLEALQAVIRP